MCVNKVDYLLLIKEACNALQYYDLNFMFITMSSFRKRRRRRRRASSGGEEEEGGLRHRPAYILLFFFTRLTHCERFTH